MCPLQKDNRKDARCRARYPLLPRLSAVGCSPLLEGWLNAERSPFYFPPEALMEVVEEDFCRYINQANARHKFDASRNDIDDGHGGC